MIGNDYALTTEDIAKLRTSSTVSFRYNRDKRLSHIEANKDADKSNPWDQKHMILVNTRVIDYTAHCTNTDADRDMASAFKLIWRYEHDADTLDTVVRLLKPGDVVTIVYAANNISGLLSEANLTVDTLHLEITRPNSKRRMRFQLAYSVTPIDSSARICRFD